MIIKFEDDKITIKGDIEITGNMKVSKEITVGETSIEVSKHGHTTVLGPTIPPIIPELG